MYGGKFAFKIVWGSLQWEENFPFLLCLTLYSRANCKYQPPGGLYSEGRFNGGFLALRFLGAYIWRGLFSEFHGISKSWASSIIRVISQSQNCQARPVNLKMEY